MVRDSAPDLFRAVDRAVRERRAKGRGAVVLDITGAKKTMTGGAFLAAGFHGIDASYVDFEAGYDKVLRRPRPGAARPGRFDDPERLFRYAFDAFAGRRPDRLAIDCAFPEDLEVLQSEFSTARDGTSIDWTRRLQEAAVQHLHQNAAHALQVLGGSSPEVSLRIENLEQLLGKRAEDGRTYIPAARLRLCSPPPTTDLYARLKVRQLIHLRGIGEASAWLLVMEFFGWRQFANRRQVGSLAGLAPTPHQRGELDRDRRISKAGNRRVRALAIELAWGWVRLQPRRP